MLIIVGTVLNCDDVFCSVSVYLCSKIEMFVVGHTFWGVGSGPTSAKASEAEAAEAGL